MKNKFIRSVLFIPGHKESFLDNLNDKIPDAIVVDLEDAVPLKKKNVARKNLEKIKRNNLKTNFFVRINNDKKNILKDIISCSKANVDSFIFPKINSANDIKTIEKKIKKNSKFKKFNFFVLIESAKALINLKEICESSENIKGLMFGAEDFLNDINILEFYEDTNIDFPRALLPLYAHSYKLNCIDTPYLNLTNRKKFDQHLKTSKSLGYTGILNIHPNQCQLSNNNYSPSNRDYKIAKKIISSNKSQKYQNQNISVLKNKLVGPPLIKRAKKIIAYYEN